MISILTRADFDRPAFARTHECAKCGALWTVHANGARTTSERSGPCCSTYLCALSSPVDKEPQQ